MENNKLNTSEEVKELIKGLNGVPIKKFLTEVRKIYKKMTTTTLWYGYSQELMNKYDLKSKDEYAIIKGEYTIENIWDCKTQTHNIKKFNFQVIPQAKKYGSCICMDIEVINENVKINDIFIKSI